MGISTSTNRRVQPRKYGAACHDLLDCNYLAIFEDFSALCQENKKYLLELKESYVMKHRPSMIITPLYLFE